MNNIIDLNEAGRCLNCKVPKCVEGCPINNRIPEFIAQIKANKYDEAYKIIRSISPLGAICGRVCPHENQCQGNCVRGINSTPIEIGKLEVAVCDWARENKIKIQHEIQENGIKIAVIGSGPSGIACAVDLRLLGYDVTIFEKENYLGGILMYGIPEYRLPKKIVTEVINDLIELGIKIQLNTILKSKSYVCVNVNEEYCAIATKEESKELFDKQKNKIITYSERDKNIPNYITIDALLREGYRAIFLGIGAEISNILPIEGNDKIGVFGANEFLKMQRNCQNKKVIVIGGGNVAMDSARVAKKEGADVTIVYRKQKENMPANKDEIEAAEREGIKFIFATNVIKIESLNAKKNEDANCKSLNVEQRNEEIKTVAYVECDTGKIIETDYVVMAIGATPNKIYLDER